MDETKNALQGAPQTTGQPRGKDESTSKETGPRTYTESEYLAEIVNIYYKWKAYSNEEELPCMPG